MTPRPLLTWLPAGLCCIAAVVLSLVPSWVLIVLIAPALMLMLVNLGLLQRDWDEVSEAIEVENRWRAQRERCR